MRPLPLLAVALLLFGCFSPPAQENGAEVVFPDGFIISAEIADTPEKQAQGLSWRTSLAENEGMLFTYSEPSRPGFWMPNMNFPLDILFLDENFTVVDLWENAPPCPSLGDCSPYWPKEDCLYVLEICANCSARHGAKTGSRLSVRTQAG